MASRWHDDGKLQATAWLLALGGYLPFLFLTAMLALDLGFIGGLGAGSGADALLMAYAAIILSFLGGIRFGLAIVRSTPERATTDELILSVVPALIGWFAFFMSGPWAYVVFAIGFAVIGWWDRQMVAAGGAPAWFGRLRMTLTVLVTATLLMAFLVSY